jgi:acyl carrier protein
MSSAAIEIETEIRAFVLDRFLFGDTAVALSNDDSLLERGIIDSTGVLEIVMFIGERYRIEVQDDELIPDNLESIKKIADFIVRKAR